MAAAPEASHQFGSIFFGQRGGVSQGQLKLTPSGVSWRRSSGGKAIEVKKEDIDSLHWMRVSRGCQLSVRVVEGVTMNFIGFREKDLEVVSGFCQQHWSMDVKTSALAVSGRNWGNVAINGKSLMFLVDGKVALEVPLPDVAQAQQVKDDLMLEFHVDDAAPEERSDCLAEMAFHVPAGHPQWVGEGEETPAKALLDAVLPHVDMAAPGSDDMCASFSDVHVLAPRGRFEVEMYLGSLTLVGQTQEFKIRYSSIQRIFVLPKSSTPHTLVVISLDPPIRKGQTYYTHILCQFSSEDEASIDLVISPEALAAKSEKCGGKLKSSMSGPLHEVFAHTLRGLSAAKITRPPKDGFQAAQDGYAVRCSYKASACRCHPSRCCLDDRLAQADDGYLYPLERAFFYVHKPPMLIPFDEVESVELTRLGGGAVSSKTFDLVVRTKTEVEHQFRGIQRGEWQGLLNFFLAKKLRVERLREAQAGPSAAAAAARAAIDFGDGDDDLGMRAKGGIDDDDDEEDEDFDIEKASGTDESSSGDLDASGDAELIAEEGISVQDVSSGGKEEGSKRKAREAESEEGEEELSEEEAPKPKKAKKAAKPAAPKAAAGAAGGGEEGAKKPRKKKDPNAPKGALSAFMYFSNANRDKIKAQHPGVKFGEVGKLLGERWKTVSPSEKAVHEAAAKQDKERYQREMAAYKASGGGGEAEDGDN
ncbi:hypothetical protein QJQ45_014103 [Haematococcus lacustris]|nr:hypothetical protein QJQ45_014103 [Haematococcus lacustris]